MCVWMYVCINLSGYEEETGQNSDSHVEKAAGSDIYIYIYIYTCVCVCMYVCMYVFIWIYTYVCVCID